MNFKLTTFNLVPPPTTEKPIIVLPRNAPYEVRFSETTTYHWTNFDVNASETTLKTGLEVEQGPFGFGNAVALDRNKQQVRSWWKSLNVDVSLLQCLSDSEFAATDDICIMNPKNRPKGEGGGGTTTRVTTVAKLKFRGLCQSCSGGCQVASQREASRPTTTDGKSGLLRLGTPT